MSDRIRAKVKDLQAGLPEGTEIKVVKDAGVRVTAAVVNVDDPRGVELQGRGLVPTEGYSLLDVDRLEVGTTSCRFVWRGVEVALPLGGRFNVSNALAALAIAHVEGVVLEVAAAALTS